MKMLRSLLVLFVLSATSLAVTGCGFTPLYGSNSVATTPDVRAALSTTEISVIPNREGQFLRNTLIDRFYSNGYPQMPDYRLDVSTINIEKDNLDITKQADTTRYQIRMRVKMHLIDMKTGKPLLERTITSVNSYNVLESQFTTRVSERNARDNALLDIAEQIERHLALYFKEK